MIGLPPRSKRDIDGQFQNRHSESRPGTSRNLVEEMSHATRSGSIGNTMKFSDHLTKRFYNDNSLDHARCTSMQSPRQELLIQRRAQSIETLNRISAIKEAQRAKHLKEGAERKKREELLNRCEAAALVIQCNIRRFLAQKQKAILLLELEKRKLAKKLGYMNKGVDNYRTHLNDRDIRAACQIQAHWKGYLARIDYDLLVHKETRQHKALVLKCAIKIQALARGFLTRQWWRIFLAERARDARLEEIRQNLLWIRFQIFWAKNRHVWRVIRMKAAQKTAFYSEQIGKATLKTGAPFIGIGASSPKSKSRKSSRSPSPLSPQRTSSMAMRNEEKSPTLSEKKDKYTVRVAQEVKEEAPEMLELQHVERLRRSQVHKSPGMQLKVTHALEEKGYLKQKVEQSEVQRMFEEQMKMERGRKLKPKKPPRSTCIFPNIDKFNFMKGTISHKSRRASFTQTTDQSTKTKPVRHSVSVKKRRFAAPTASRQQYLAVTKPPTAQPESHRRWRHTYRPLTKEEHRQLPPSTYYEDQNLTIDTIGSDSEMSQREVEDDSDIESTFDQTVLNDEENERIEVYRPTVPHTSDFKTALPNFHKVLDMYGANVIRMMEAPPKSTIYSFEASEESRATLSLKASQALIQ